MMIDLLYVHLKRCSLFLLLVCFLVYESLTYTYAMENVDWSKVGRLLLRVYQDISDDSPFHDHQEIDARAQLENTIAFKEWDATVTINSEVRFESFIGDDTQKDVDVVLREAFVELRRENYSVSVGRQTVTWGKLDDIFIVDRLNPQDFKWFLLYEKQERKEPQFMFKLNWYAEDFDLQGVYIPYFDPSYVRFFGSDWAVFGHLQEIVAAQGSFPAMTMVTTQEQEGLAENTFENGQAGLRLRSRMQEIDYALYYMWVYHSIPTLREKTTTGNLTKQFLYFPTPAHLAALLAAAPTQNDLTLEREHPRTHIVGGDFETVIGEYGVRGEFAWVSDSPYLRRDFSYTTHDTLSFGVGIDHTDAANWYYNIQFIEDIVLQYSDLFAQEEFSHLLTLTLRKDFLRGRLLLDFDCAYRPSYGDRMFNPTVTYKFAKDVELTFGGYIFGGELTTLFGRYSDKDLIYLELLYQF